MFALSPFSPSHIVYSQAKISEWPELVIFSNIAVTNIPVSTALLENIDLILLSFKSFVL